MDGVVLQRKNKLKKYLIIGFFILSLFLLWSIFLDKKDNLLKFSMLDVGQGDALFIESPTKVQVLVDGGPGNNLSRQISKVIPWHDRHIDILVVTNPDRDHYEGFIKLLDKYSVGLLIEPGVIKNDPVYEVFKNKIKDKNIETVLARRGQVIDIGDGAYLQVLFPDRNVSQVSPNMGSIVMKLFYKNTNVILQGDSLSNIENYLLEIDGDYLKSDILKVGHHGSKTSSIENYVAKVNPDFALVSAGENNPHGHPHKEVIDIFSNLGIPVYSTCNNGNINFKSDGEKFTLKNKKIKQAIVGCKTNI